MGERVRDLKVCDFSWSKPRVEIVSKQDGSTMTAVTWTSCVGNRIGVYCAFNELFNAKLIYQCFMSKDDETFAKYLENELDKRTIAELKAIVRIAKDSLGEFVSAIPIEISSWVATLDP